MMFSSLFIRPPPSLSCLLVFAILLLGSPMIEAIKLDLDDPGALILCNPLFTLKPIQIKILLDPKKHC